MTKQQKANKNKKAAYKVKNWAQYNRSLINRGSLTIWITPEVLDSWKDQRPAQRGAQFEYSDLAIEALLALKFLLKLPYRAVQGFGQSLFNLLEIELPVPNYTTLSRRANSLTIALPPQTETVRHIVMDATGLKVYGEGEWKVRKHGYSKWRTWRKLHLSIDPETQEIVVAQLTPNSVTDGQAGVTMLQELPNTPDQVTGDGGYDQRPFSENARLSQLAKSWCHPNATPKSGNMVTVSGRPTRETKICAIFDNMVIKNGNETTTITSALWPKRPCFVTSGCLGLTCSRAMISPSATKRG